MLAIFDSITQVGVAGAAIFASYQAHRANRQTKGTGNGFARHTTESLHRIEKQCDDTHALVVQHLEDHAEHDLKG